MSGKPFVYTFAGGLTISLSPRLASELERALVRHRSRATPRDLTPEIEAVLEATLSATIPEIARAIKARDHEVREALIAGSQFRLVPAPPGRSRKAKTWALVPETSGLVPEARTSPTSDVRDELGRLRNEGTG